jgi:hypothetical protein
MYSHNGYFISSFSSMTLVNSFNQEEWAPWWWRITGTETCMSGYKIINKYIQSLMYLVGFNSFKSGVAVWANIFVNLRISSFIERALYDVS